MLNNINLVWLISYIILDINDIIIKANFFNIYILNSILYNTVIYDYCRPMLLSAYLLT